MLRVQVGGVRAEHLGLRPEEGQGTSGTATESKEKVGKRVTEPT